MPSSGLTINANSVNENLFRTLLKVERRGPKEFRTISREQNQLLSSLLNDHWRRELDFKLILLIMSRISKVQRFHLKLRLRNFENHPTFVY